MLSSRARDGRVDKQMLAPTFATCLTPTLTSNRIYDPKPVPLEFEPRPASQSDWAGQAGSLGLTNARALLWLRDSDEALGGGI
ncbi:unnamed protein product [Protopolystoma xenopodis]|uniref:Uncharacterized protein n=1 Tax=Protopolystoma xenopodis TaxID=117903 RepID=A0A448XRC0_9PLAT|nr:unnamed protein product [Protopolystoma xenopodis]